MRLERKVALITGGYGGMGRASARLFAKEGATVFIAGRNEERGDALVAEINEAGGKAHFVELKSPSFCSRSQAESPHIFCVLPLSDEFRERIAFLR